MKKTNSDAPSGKSVKEVKTLDTFVVPSMSNSSSVVGEGGTLMSPVTPLPCPLYFCEGTEAFTTDLSPCPLPKEAGESEKPRSTETPPPCPLPKRAGELENSENSDTSKKENPEVSTVDFDVLAHIQNEVRVLKTRQATFGRSFSYRNCEDIYNAIKPVLVKYNCHLYVVDSIMQIGDRFYVRADATLYQTVKGESVVIGRGSAYAREAESLNGMNPAQITGACSSYARKYAMNGLFLLDDVKDMDEVEPESPARTTTNPAQSAATRAKAKEPVSVEMPNNDFAKTVCQEIESCQTTDELADCWHRHESLQKEPWFVHKIKEYGNMIKRAKKENKV